MKKNIYILEKFDFSDKQIDRLKKLGNVKFYDKAQQSDIEEAANKADVVMVDWIDPTDLITKMKKGSFVCLPFTGYGWISTIGQAIKNGVTLANTPNYSTNAVAEHHLALLMAVCKHVTLFNEGLKKKDVPNCRNMEISGKTVGIIGLGHIGYRLAELLKPFNVKLLTTNTTPKMIKGIKDVDLETLLKQSDIICITCQLNDKTKNMIGSKELEIMKDNAIITATTNGVIDHNALEKTLKKGKLFGVGLEEFMDMKDVPMSLIKRPNVVSTYHRAYDTFEAENNRLEMAVCNIEAFLAGKPTNVIKG